MSALKQFLRRIPYWAYLLVLIVVVVNTAYLFFRFQIPEDGVFIDCRNGQCLITSVVPGSPGEKAGLRVGDIILEQNNIPITPDIFLIYYARAGDTIKALIERDKKKFTVQYICGSRRNDMGFLAGMYILILLVSIGSLYILYKKPGDKAARIFFIYIQLFAMGSNAGHIQFQDPVATFANVAFLVSGSLFGAALIHFYLLFPRPASIYTKFKFLPIPFYAIGFLLSIIYTAIYIRMIYQPSVENGDRFFTIDHYVVIWISITFFAALVVAIYQFITIKNTLARNQIRLVIIGALFAFLTPMTFAFFPEWIFQFNYTYILEIFQAAGSFIMIIFLLLAVFRYRIWDIEFFIRKALLYLGATLVITFSYLLLIWAVDRMITRETNLIRFLAVAVSVILFLILRDRIQHMIDRIFHRESYDSATVVSDFEGKLAGIYRFEELKEKIVQGLDEIFHFKSFVFNLKKNKLTYEPAFVFGINEQKMGSDFEVTTEFEEKLRNSKVFSPEELNKKPPAIEFSNGELIVPMISDHQPAGFFICGQKKSERVYSQQDIRVLTLLARRVIALLHTATLYQKDLNRQVMLERERTRISQDMHDDVGASLTRISILSELAKNNTETEGETKQWLGQISDTSREVMEEMSQIIWALNPKNDTLEGLIAYIRRFAFEYFEPTAVKCFFDLPEFLPSIALSVEVRRNIYLSVREALHNVVKHSGAYEVKISLRKNERHFQIIIKDNGNGFDPKKLEFPGNGLLNMKRRMNDIGGEFQIHSNVGKGTEISLVIPI